MQSTRRFIGRLALMMLSAFAFPIDYTTHHLAANKWVRKSLKEIRKRADRAARMSKRLARLTSAAMIGFAFDEAGEVNLDFGTDARTQRLFAIADEKQVDAKLSELRGGDFAHAIEARDGARQAIDAALSELGTVDNASQIDFAKMESLGVGTAAARQKVFMGHVADLKAASRVIAERRAMAGEPMGDAERAMGIAASDNPGPIAHLEKAGALGQMQEMAGAPITKARPQNASVYMPVADLLSLSEAPSLGGRASAFSDVDTYGAVFQTSDGIGRDTRRSGEVGYAANVGPVSVLNYIAMQVGGSMVESGAVKYLKEVLTSDAAAEKAEGAAASQFDISYTDATAKLETIRGLLPVTEEQLDDVPGAREFISRRLIRLARARLARQVVVGSGVSPFISGLSTQAGQTRDVTATAANGPTAPIAAIRQGLRLVASSGDYEATAILINDEIWANEQAKVSNGIYELGAPTGMLADALWRYPTLGVPVLDDGKQNDEVFAIVADLQRAARVFLKRDAEVQVGYTADDFDKYQVRLRVVLRAALAVYAAHGVVKLQADI